MSVGSWGLVRNCCARAPSSTLIVQPAVVAAHKLQFKPAVGDREARDSRLISLRQLEVDVAGDGRVVTTRLR